MFITLEKTVTVTRKQIRPNFHFGINLLNLHYKMRNSGFEVNTSERREIY